MSLLANPPFNDSDTALCACAFLQSDVKIQVVCAAKNNNANFAWPRSESGFIHSILRSLGEGGHLAPQGMAGFVLADGSMSSNQSGDCPARSAMKMPKAKPQSLPRQRDIRQKLIEADLVDCMVALPGQLFRGMENSNLPLAA